jgi:hypothetical protein
MPAKRDDRLSRGAGRLEGLAGRDRSAARVRPLAPRQRQGPRARRSGDTRKPGPSDWASPCLLAVPFLIRRTPEGLWRKNNLEDQASGVLGNINPDPGAREHIENGRGDTEEREAADESMAGGSRRDRGQHSGSRDVTEGTTGGAGTETGGTRNYRQGSGAAGGDIGNRPGIDRRLDVVRNVARSILF